MTPRTSIVGGISALPIMRDAKQRRVLFAVLVALFGLLALYPEKYRAAVSLTPTDPASLGLSGTLGQLGAVQSVFGNQAAVEISLKVARSDYVRSVAAKQLGLQKLLGKDDVQTSRWLEDKVAIRALRGGIIEISVDLDDPAFAKRIVAGYSEAVRIQLAQISLRQTAYKRKVLEGLVLQAGDRLEKAQKDYDEYRLKTRYTLPSETINAQGSRVPQLEQMIRDKLRSLSIARQFATDQNMQVRAILAEISSLREQLIEAKSVSTSDQSTVGWTVAESTKVDKLRRSLDLAQSLYDNYKRFLLGTSVENLTVDANIRILEPPYIQSARVFNTPFALISGLIFLIGMAIEFYLIKLPLGVRRSHG